jgi:sugar phosphate isomerase/epimerase
MYLCFEADSVRREERDFAYAVRAAKDLGFKAIEPEVMTGRCLLSEYGYCNITSLQNDPMDMRRMVEAAGLKVAALSAHSSLIDVEWGVDYLREAIRFAYILGSPIVNTSEGPVPAGMSDDEAFRRMKANIDRLVDAAEKYGIVLTVEPHGKYTTRADTLARILDLNRSPHFACNFDTGNVAVAGNDSVATLKAVIDRVAHVHLKDIRRAKLADGHETGTPAGCPIGDGEVDIRGCLALLKARGYSGALSIEVDGREALLRSKEFLEPLLG